MYRQTIGEGILRLLTTADRASAIVGDLDQNGVSQMQFWLAIGSNVLHAISPAILKVATKGFLAQFAFTVLFAPVMFLSFFLLPIPYLKWIQGLVMLCVQVLMGFWITRQEQKQALLICLLVVGADCAAGLLNLNNASINMSIWAIPLLVTTAAVCRGRRMKKTV